MAHRPPRGTRASSSSNLRRLVLWSLGALLVLAVVVFAYQATRAGLALREARSDARLLKQQLAEGDEAAATGTMRALASRADTARSHTDNLLWDAVGRLPFLGENVRAVQVVSRVLDQTSSSALPVTLELSRTVSGDGLRSADGRFDLAVIAGLQPDVERLQQTAQSAAEDVDGIDLDALVGPVRRATAEVADQVHTLRSTASAAGDAVQLLPSMLGQDGRRTYLLAVQNNAEVRATGGLPGSLSIITAEDGRLELGRQLSGLDFPTLKRPVLPLSAGELALYGKNLGEDVRDTNLTPDFPRTAALMTAMVERRFDLSLDGVITVDPVALSSLLEATGPIRVGKQTFTADNVVAEVLHRPYQRYDTQEEQNGYFARAARGIFDSMLHTKANQVTLLRSLADVATQRRLLVWSRHREEQQVLHGTPVAAELPQGSAGATSVGMYLNDGTAGKMEYYLDYEASFHSTSCTKAGAQTLSARMVFSSSAPRDPSDLSPFVTGIGNYSPQGTMLVNLRIYAPVGGTLTRLEANGSPIRIAGAEHDGRQVALVPMLIKPAEEIRVSATLKTPAGQRGDPVLQWTPGVHTDSSARTAPSSCA